MDQVIVETRVHIAEHPRFREVFGPDSIWETALAWLDAYRTDESDDDSLRDMAEQGLVRAGWPREEAAKLVRKLARKNRRAFRQAMYDAILWELEDQLQPTSGDLEDALECRLDYGWTTWDRILQSLGEIPVYVLSDKLPPQRLACPWPAQAACDLGSLVDVSWVEELAREALENSRVNYHVEDGMSVRVELRASPELAELLSLVVQARGAFALREGASLEEVLAAAALTGQDTEELLGPFRSWLKDLAGTLIEHVVPPLCDVVNNRFQTEIVNGKYVVDALQIAGLLAKRVVPGQCVACTA